MKGLIRHFAQARFASALFIILFIVTVLVTPSRFSFSNIGITLGLMTPLILAAVAATPVILAGREGIDLSVGPLIGIINVIIVKWLIIDWGLGSPLQVIPAALFIGLLAGAVNGLLVVKLRIQPIVATLGSYLVLSGFATWILPSPLGPVPGWLTALSEQFSVLPLLGVALLWWGIKSLPLHDLIKAIGGDDRAAYSAGVNVDRVRFICYLLTGLFASVAAISLTALLGSADAQVGPNYTLLAIAAAALGGVSLAGGKGNMTGAALGAVDIFLLQNLITHFNVSSFFLQITYGTVLVVAVCLNSERLGRYLVRNRERQDA